MIERKISAVSLIVAIIITAIVASVGTYFLAPREVVEKPGTKKLELIVGQIHVSPTDVGWSYQHAVCLDKVAEKYPFVRILRAEDVPAGDYIRTAEAMIEQGAKIIIGDTLEYVSPAIELANSHPDIIVYNRVGTEPLPSNMGYFYADLYEAYYLDGLIAGAYTLVTGVNKIGFVAPHLISDVYRYVNAFHLGAREINPNVETKVIESGTWFDPPTERSIAQQLIQWGAVAIEHYQDSPAINQACQDYYEDTGNRVLCFSHASPYLEYGPDVVAAGHIEAWDVIYEKYIIYALANQTLHEDFWGYIGNGVVVFGADYNVMINPNIIDMLEEVTVSDPVLGEVSVYDLIMYRLSQFKDPRVTFHIFTGPIYDVDGNLKLKPGEVMDLNALRYEFDWFVEGVIPP